jgi:hypothetical protein
MARYKGHAARITGMRNAYQNCQKKLKASVHSRDLGVYEKIILKCIFKNREKWRGPDSSGS